MTARAQEVTLLLGGTLCDAALWSGVSLPENAAVLPMVRGSSWPDAAARALEMLGPQPRFHLLGFSMWAILAFEVLRHSPERVSRLTLLGANPHAPTPTQLEAWAEQERRVRAGEFEAVARAQSQFAGPHQEEVLAMALRVGPEIFLDQLALLRSRPDSRSTLVSYRGLLRVLVGERDPLTPPHLAVEMAALRSGAELSILPGVGHYLPLEAPDAVSRALREVAHA